MAFIELLAHRGLWEQLEERNQPKALEAALRAGFGVETDIRDFQGTLVISHDMPNGEEQTFEQFLAQYQALGCKSTLALNIKADGMAKQIQALLEQFQVTNYFCFDMAIPDLLAYWQSGMTYFARRSEYEPLTPITDIAPGIWLDAFQGQWFSVDDIWEHLKRGQDVCVVSPELHRRDYETTWHQLVELRDRLNSLDSATQEAAGQLMLCTDFPQKFPV